MKKYKTKIDYQERFAFLLYRNFSVIGCQRTAKCCESYKCIINLIQFRKELNEAFYFTSQ